MSVTLIDHSGMSDNSANNGDAVCAFLGVVSLSLSGNSIVEYNSANVMGSGGAVYAREIDQMSLQGGSGLVDNWAGRTARTQAQSCCLGAASSQEIRPKMEAASMLKYSSTPSVCWMVAASLTI